MRPGIHSGKGRAPEEETECLGGGPNSCREKAFNQLVLHLGPSRKRILSTPALRITQPQSSRHGLNSWGLLARGAQKSHLCLRPVLIIEYYEITALKHIQMDRTCIQ